MFFNKFDLYLNPPTNIMVNGYKWKVRHQIVNLGIWQKKCHMLKLRHWWSSLSFLIDFYWVAMMTSWISKTCNFVILLVYTWIKWWCHGYCNSVILLVYTWIKWWRHGYCNSLILLVYAWIKWWRHGSCNSVILLV